MSGAKAVFPLEGLTGSQREYIAWLLAICAINKVTVADILDPAALDLLASRLRTPLQIEQHLTLALERNAYRRGNRRIRALEADRRS
jgi:type II secretory pathway predicted ATPase ExeA